MLLADSEEEVGFIGSVSSKLGDGSKIPFWTIKWISHKPLCYIFTYLFQAVAEESKLCSVTNMGWWEENVWKWGLHDSFTIQDHRAGGELEELCCILSEIAQKGYF